MGGTAETPTIGKAIRGGLAAEDLAFLVRKGNWKQRREGKGTGDIEAPVLWGRGNIPGDLRGGGFSVSEGC